MVRLDNNESNETNNAPEGKTMDKFNTAFNAGFDAKTQEIQEIGFAAACAKFNLDCPVGVKWEGSQEGLEYCRGEMAALERAAR